MATQAIPNPFETQSQQPAASDQAIANPFEDTASVSAPPQKPGFFKRALQAVGMPSSMDELRAAGEAEANKSFKQKTLDALLDSQPAIKLASSYVQDAASGIKQGNEQTAALKKKIDAGQAVTPDDLSASAPYLRVLPVIGRFMENQDVDAQHHNTAGLLGGSVGMGLALGAPEFMSRGGGAATETASKPGLISRAKTALFTTPEERAAAARPTQTAEEINRSALPDLQTQVGKALDNAAAVKGADTSGVSTLSQKAAQGGAAWKTAGQAKYKLADDIAAKATGQPGAFQRLGQAVQNVKEALADPEITPEERTQLTERLQGAQRQLDAYQQLAASKGIDVDALTKAADKEYSTGLSLEEFGRGILKQETASGAVKPSRLPLDAPVRNLTAAASKRGHVLENALGPEGSQQVQGAVSQAAQKINAGRAENTATKAAQARVKQVRNNRIKAAGALGAAGALYKKKQAIGAALSGE